jgi:phosphoserine aminotransferase
VPANFRILFLQGGGIGENDRADEPARFAQERRLRRHRFVVAEVAQRSAEVLHAASAASGKTADGSRAPARARWQLSDDPAYVHLCTNETIDGVEFEIPDLGDVPLVADVSSHILSRPIDVAKYGVLFGGAQKNIGPAGVTS